MKDKTFVSLITDSYPDIIQKYSNIKDPKLKWELIKMEIRGITIPYTTNRAKEVWEIENGLEKRLGKFTVVKKLQNPRKKNTNI